MMINIMESDGSVSASIPLQDIDHVETRTLSFFGDKAHSLYLFLKKEQGSYFVLLTYNCPVNMEQAMHVLQDSLAHSGQGIATTTAQTIELFPFAAPAEGLVV